MPQAKPDPSLRPDLLERSFQVLRGIVAIARPLRAFLRDEARELYDEADHLVRDLDRERLRRASEGEFHGRTRLVPPGGRGTPAEAARQIRLAPRDADGVA